MLFKYCCPLKSLNVLWIKVGNLITYLTLDNSKINKQTNKQTNTSENLLEQESAQIGSALVEIGKH